jgi:molybdopterin synthase sulfur carrier subunit
VKVILPSPLEAYTAGLREVQASGATLAGLLADLDRQFPGIRFRMIDEQDAIRPHIKLFVNRELSRSLDTALRPGDEVLVVAALSGG